LREATVRLRQRVAEPNGLMGAITMGVVIYVFAGFWVYWLKTGQTTVGVGGRITTIGELVWIAPLMVWGLLYFVIEDRGPFQALYVPRSTVEVGDDGLSWHTPTAANRWDWEAIGGVSCLGEKAAQTTTVFDSAGVELGSISGVMVDTRTRRASRLPETILDVRRDMFEALNPTYPGNGCVRRSASSSGDPGRSAP
jgi:hypothetical protein